MPSTVPDTSLYSPLNTVDHSIMSPPASRLPLITTSKVAAGKNPLANPRDIKGYRLGPCVGKTPWKRKRQPTPTFLPEKPHGQRSQVGYNPWGRKESARTERLCAFAMQSSATGMRAGAVTTESRMGVPLKPENQSHHVIQQSHSWGYASGKTSKWKTYMHPNAHCSTSY